MKDINIKNIENILGIEFNNKGVLITALTHSSYVNQFKDVKYNERLEFLGDSVLQLCITQYLFNNYKDKSEGELTKIRSLIVCENSLYEVAKKLNLGVFIRMSKGEESTGGRERTSIQADCLEAIIAAIYLDKGLDVANDFIFKSTSGTQPFILGLPDAFSDTKFSKSLFCGPPKEEIPSFLGTFNSTSGISS